ncbi:hypothetical protein FDG2_5530 [Candidatus Protofrankia californiensis]|uniref:RND family efflux transporter MFP subunit n=1 Tax=Candidatus Protofrankia californiensis TaxID=1839754 RepID=A0A1C3PE40_9ACTN|nr:hypothetical protein FDG2_5530 [Candidatus Protofrankia californiensis]
MRPSRRRTVFVLVWLAVTVAVAAMTARVAAPDAASGETAGSTSDVAAVRLADRATVSVTQERIQPVLSLDGSVQPAEPTAGGGGFDIVASVQPVDLAYRLIEPPAGIQAAILGGPTGFPCAYKGLVAASSEGGPSAVGTSVRCGIPSSVRAVAGLSATIVIALDAGRVAPALPLSAVVGSAQQGQVVVVSPDGRARSVRTVTLGVSDPMWMEIRDGLSPGDQVLERPVQSDLLSR